MDDARIRCQIDRIGLDVPDRARLGEVGRARVDDLDACLFLEIVETVMRDVPASIASEIS